MKKIILTVAVVVLVELFVVIVLLNSYFTDAVAYLTFQSIGKSHINANIPGEQDFDTILLDSLYEHFSEYPEATYVISFELLRDFPTQTGIAYPKYYAWITIMDSNGQIKVEGAARLAAIDKSAFHVTDFLAEEEIQNNPIRLYRMFPSDVARTLDMRFFEKEIISEN